jgi:hypothetical protein
MKTWIMIKWFHTAIADQPNGYEKMGGLYRLRGHLYLGNENPDGLDILDASVCYRFKKVFLHLSLVERGIWYANTRITFDKFTNEDLESGVDAVARDIQ